ncbi:MAG: hypothetical protein ABIA93_07820 [Candidatus Woesearchaeota archaeon]
MDSEYTVLESPDFYKHYKKVRKKYKHTFDNDFKLAIQVITKKLAILNGNYLNLPGTPKTVDGLGEKATHAVVYTRVHIREAQDKVGRLVYIVDKSRERIYLIDVYYKSEREDPDKAICAKGHMDYDAFIEAEEKQKE